VIWAGFTDSPVRTFPLCFRLTWRKNPQALHAEIGATRSTPRYAYIVDCLVILAIARSVGATLRTARHHQAIDELIAFGTFGKGQRIIVFALFPLPDPLFENTY